VKPEDINRRDPDWDALGTLFGAYLHQDYDAEYKDAWGAVKAYRSENSSSFVSRAIAQIDRLLEELKTEEELERASQRLGSAFYPPGTGWTYRDWLTEVARILRGEG
jgi:urease accessory protein UreF